MVSRISFSLTLPGIKLRVTSLKLPRLLFLPFLKMGVIIAFFQHSGTSSCHYDLSEVIVSGLTMRSVSSVSPYGYFPSGPMDMCTSSLFTCSVIWSSFTEGKSSLLQTFPLDSRIWDWWSQVFPLKTEEKEFSTLVFSMSFVTGSLAPFSIGHKFSLIPSCWYNCHSHSCCPSCPLPHSTPDGLSIS